MLVFQDTPPAIEGQVCEALLLQAHYYRGALVDEASSLFLKLQDRLWHRVFIEAGVVFWHRVDGLDSPDQDRHHYTLTDLAAAHGLAGQRVTGVTVADVPSGGALRLAFAGGPTVVLSHVDGRSHVAVEAAPAATVRGSRRPG